MRTLKYFSRPLPILAVLLLTISACAMFHPIDLYPELPNVKKIPAKVTLVLEDFEDARPKSGDWTPEWTGQHNNHRFVFDRPVAEKVADLIQDLFVKSGYRIVREKSSEVNASTPIISGKLDVMEAKLSKQPFQPPLICTIRLRLSLQKDGSPLVQKTLDVQHQRRGVSIMADESYTKVVNETFEKLLDEVADFIESEEFGKAVAR